VVLDGSVCFGDGKFLGSGAEEEDFEWCPLLTWTVQFRCRCFGYAQGVLGGLLTVPAFLDRFPQMDILQDSTIHTARIVGELLSLEFSLDICLLSFFRVTRKWCRPINFSVSLLPRRFEK
jgi:hypothetical protein